MRRAFWYIVGTFYLALKRMHRRIASEVHKSRIRKCGNNVYISDNCRFIYENVEIGSNVYIGPNCIFSSTNSRIFVGDYVMFGPNVSVHGGDHRTDVLGKYMYEVKDKLPRNDADVFIDTDCWIGDGAVILKGVTIGRGCIIGAGTVVNQSLPPYSICVGMLEQKVRKRWSDEEIEIHEMAIKKRQNGTNI